MFDTSHYLHPSREKLLNDDFSMFLQACQESEFRTVLNFLRVVGIYYFYSKWVFFQ